MFPHIYIEEEVLDHPKTQAITERFPKAQRVPISRYTEVFNRKGQNFRLQKKQPALILAKKFKNFVLETPPGYGIGGKKNYYFSHMLNCIFDCRYCFLQGMYNSANYVIFVNFEDFTQAMEERISSEETYFFSGYDCDSLALEPITHFAKGYLPFFAKHKKAFLELRTKSTNIAFLQKTTPLSNCIVAFTLSPEEIVREYEHKTPSLKKRLAALKKLQEQGWPIGLRFDPLLYCEDFKEVYARFFKEVFSVLQPTGIHSITLGVFRLPKPFFKKMRGLYPKEKLFALVTEEGSTFSYPESLSQEMRAFCQEEVLKYIPETLLYSCEV
ncbi:MAG: Spore photoproduct lyase [Chlamydiae bacterium]|nr:Spore photoproduct lyase [Chlamydiota bacterium]